MVGHCSACGAETDENVASCPQCGYSPASSTPPTADIEDRVDASSGDDGVAPGPADSDAQTPGAVEGNETLWSGSYSPRALLPAWLLATVATVLVSGVSVPFAGFWNALFIAFMCAVLTLGGVGLYLAYRRLSVRYELTAERLESQSGFFTRTTHWVRVADIDDVAFDQTSTERRLGIGTIQVMLADDTRPDMLLRCVGNVHAVAQLINDARHEARVHLGLFFEDES